MKENDLTDVVRKELGPAVSVGFDGTSLSNVIVLNLANKDTSKPTNIRKSLPSVVRDE